MKFTDLLRAVLSVAIIATTTFCVDAAVKKTKKRTAANTGIVITKGATHTYGDGILTTQDFSYKRGKTTINIEYPVGGNDNLVREIREWIKARVAENYTGPIETPNGMIQKRLANNKKDGTVEYAMEVSIPYSNAKIVTVNFKDYGYWGGAHGGSVNQSGTFSMPDAQLLTASMLPSINKMRPYILQALAEEGLEREYLFAPESIDYGVPFVMADGLHIIYGEYEIGPFSLGLPEAVLPMSKIKGLLSPEIVNKYF